MRYKNLFSVVVIISSLLFIIISCSLISSEVLLGNLTGDSDSVYVPSGPIKGWINISLNNEPANNLLTVFNYSIKILDVLKNQSNANYNCTPSDCNTNYDANSPDTSKTFSFSTGEDKIFGIKITGNLDTSSDNGPITQISFNIASDAQSSCTQALKIDLADDGEIDWIPINGTNEFGCSRATTCFNPSSSTVTQRMIDNKGFCEKIFVPARGSFRVGANIIKGTTLNPGLKMDVYNDDMDRYTNGECSLNVTSSGESSCVVNLGLNTDTNITVCVKADVQTDYQISAETEDPVCGFYNIQEPGDGVDYPIFAEGGKYAPIGNFIFKDNTFKNYEDPKSTTLLEYINQYINDRYDNNCNSGCVIPISFHSNINNQNIVISNLSLFYTTRTGSTSDNKFYDISENAARINSDFQKLYLEPLNFTVPYETGNKTMSIRVGSREVFSKNILIKIMPTVNSLSPTEAYAGIPVNFTISMLRSDSNMTYTWNFGDNSSEQTTKWNIIEHTYPRIGSFSLKVRATGTSGEMEKTFSINVLSPLSKINETIADFRIHLNNFQNQTSKLSSFASSNILNKSGIDDVKDELHSIEVKFDQGFIDSNKAVDIINELYSLKVPNKLILTQKINPSVLYVAPEQLDLSVLDDMGAGKIDSEKTKEDYVKAINSYLTNNIDIKLESLSYSISYFNKNIEDAGTVVKVVMTPKESIDKFYFIINGDRDKIVFNGDQDISPRSVNDVRMEFTDFAQEKTIEFYYPEKLTLDNIPIFVSPMFNELNLNVEAPKCNANKICESDIGEDSSNCSDCPKPWILQSLIYIIILLVVAFIVYIILQEWYKRNYERSLFSDKNQLFNLINFMNSNEIQGQSKSQIFKKLREVSWTTEQLDYAWKRLHGERTGMWEIPIFTGMQNNQVRRQIQIRQQNTYRT